MTSRLRKVILTLCSALVRLEFCAQLWGLKGKNLLAWICIRTKEIVRDWSNCCVANVKTLGWAGVRGSDRSALVYPGVGSCKRRVCGMYRKSELCQCVPMKEKET